MPNHKKTQDHSNLLLTSRELILKASCCEFKGFKEWILTTQEDTGSAKPTYPLTIALLQCFSYLFPEEMPSRLPLKRDIQHQIDSIIGAYYQINLLQREPQGYNGNT